MGHASRAERTAAQRRRMAVRMYRSGTPVAVIARKLKQSWSWVYKWIAYRARHPWTRFRSSSRASHHHPNQTPVVVERRVLRLRQQLVHHASPDTRFAGVGARTIQGEYRKRYGPPPSLSNIQRILNRNRCTTLKPKRKRYRPHPAAEYPNAVQATDIITRWITGGTVVQTFNTVDVYSNDASSTTHANKTAVDARHHLLNTWKTLGIPDWAQFDNESAFSGGRYARKISQVVRLCLYFGIAVLFTPLDEADYNWPVEIFNELWAKQFWSRHQFSRRCDVPRVQRTFLEWYQTTYIPPRQSDTPVRLRRGYSLHRLPTRWADQVPDSLPICAGEIHAVRCADEMGYVSFLHESFRIGKRYAGRYVWLTVLTRRQRLTVWYQPYAQAEWRKLKELDYPLDEAVLPVPKKFTRLHA
jgi:hypothetical protein